MVLFSLGPPTRERSMVAFDKSNTSIVVSVEGEKSRRRRARERRGGPERRNLVGLDQLGGLVVVDEVTDTERTKATRTRKKRVEWSKT